MEGSRLAQEPQPKNALAAEVDVRIALTWLNWGDLAELWRRFLSLVFNNTERKGLDSDLNCSG